MEEKEYLTKEKFKALGDELEYLKKVKRKEVAEQLEYTKSLGDLSENAEYHEVRDMQGVVEDRIQKVESILKNATIVSVEKIIIYTDGGARNNPGPAGAGAVIINGSKRFELKKFLVRHRLLYKDIYPVQILSFRHYEKLLLECCLLRFSYLKLRYFQTYT